VNSTDTITKRSGSSLKATVGKEHFTGNGAQTGIKEKSILTTLKLRGRHTLGREGGSKK
jgi:hypothetical protein